MNRTSTSPTHTISLEEKISCFEICSADFASNLICIATSKLISLGIVRFPEESDIDTFEFIHLKDIFHNTRCDAICFSPETSLVVIPKQVTFCAAGGDLMLRVYRTDLNNSDSVQELKAHSSYINDVSWDSEGEYLASVSDDHTCRVWCASSNYTESVQFCLSSPGMSIKWHPEEPCKLLVAEKNGTIHLCNVQTQLAIISVESPKSPLMAADWALSNRLCVCAIAAGDIVTWDLRRPCTPAEVKQVHEDGGRIVRFSPNNEMVVASVGRPGVTLKVTAKSMVPLIDASLKLCGGLSWHHRLPYIAAADDRKLCFWKVQIK